MRVKEVKKILGVTNRTVCNYVKTGKIRFTKINNCRYDYNDEDVYRLAGKSIENRKVVTYSRVSLSKQKSDLESQTKRLYDFAISNGYVLDHQYSDVKSGMNFNDRKDFNRLMTEILDNKIDTIIIENKDRLCRFGFDMFENLCKCFNTKIIVTSNVEDKTYEQELTEDLVSIIHHFSMKAYSNRRKLNKMKEIMQEVDNA